MKNKSIFSMMDQNLTISIILLLFFNVLLFLGSRVYFFIGLGLSVIVIVFLILRNRINKKRWEGVLDELAMHIEEAGNEMIYTMPLPLLITDNQGEIIWFNAKMRSIIAEGEVITGRNILDFFPLWDFEEIRRGDRQFYEQKINDRIFEVFYTSARKNGEELYTFIWDDISKMREIEEKYDEEKTLFAHIQIDNYDEVLSSSDNNAIPFIESELSRIIQLWAKRNEGVIHKLDDTNYICVFQKRRLDNMIGKRFSLLDEIREVSKGNKYPLTLSVGINVESDNLISMDEESQQALELALGRGGDQAVVKRGSNYEFFGGRSKSVQRKSRVKSRVIAQAIATLIKDSDKVYIMGHRYPDLDAMGAAIGMYRATKNLEKNAFIILNNKQEDSVKDLLDNFVHDEYYKFIPASSIDGRVGEKDLLIIVDTHRPSLVEAPELVDQFEKRVVIDHHRRSADALTSASLFYLEPYASSASELVTEILQYITDRVVLKENEANALLSGIVLDTKNFIFNTGVRTFDAASFLRKKGASTQQIRDYFQDNLEESIMRGNIIGDAKTFLRDDLVISICQEKDENIKKIISQSADALINIRNIKTSFVIGQDDTNTVFVSARSDGSVNVQIVLEAIGGGGHLEVAGAQFQDKSMEEVEEELKEAIRKSLEE